MGSGDGKDRMKFSSEEENQQSKRKKSEIDEFVGAIARIAVVQVCGNLGYQSFQQSALDTLADVGVRYIREIGKLAVFYANLANRSQCNAFDVIQGLEDLGSLQGFSSASVVRHSLSGSGIVKDIIRYVGRDKEIPFSYLVPGFPVVKERRLSPSFAQAELNPPDERIPSWLPKFPDPETYADLDSGNLKASETGMNNKLYQVEVRSRKVERALMNFQQKIICAGSEAGVSVEQENAAKAQRAAESNPFLAPPLQYGEREVSLPDIGTRLLDEAMGYHQRGEPMESHVLALEQSFPANEAAASVGLCKPEDNRNILLCGRPSVRFKFGNGKKNGKKSSSMAMNRWKSERECLLKSVSHLDEKDEKKRTKQILWENMGYPRELSHL